MTNTIPQNLPAVFLTPEDARAAYQVEHNLIDYSPGVRDMLTPEFPQGTREYSDYWHALMPELAKLRTNSHPYNTTEWLL